MMYTTLNRDRSNNIHNEKECPGPFSTVDQVWIIKKTNTVLTSKNNVNQILKCLTLTFISIQINRLNMQSEILILVLDI